MSFKSYADQFEKDEEYRPETAYPVLGDIVKNVSGQAYLPLIVKTVMEFRKHNPKKSKQFAKGASKLSAKVQKAADPTSWFGGDGITDSLLNQWGFGTKSSDESHEKWSDEYPAKLAETIGWGAWSDDPGPVAARQGTPNTMESLGGSSAESTYTPAIETEYNPATEGLATVDPHTQRIIDDVLSGRYY